MQIINKDEFYGLEGRAAGSKFTPIKIRLEDLEVGQALIIEKTDWLSKTPPMAAIHTNYAPANKKHNPKRFTVKTLSESRGWAVLRLQ